MFAQYGSTNNTFKRLCAITSLAMICAIIMLIPIAIKVKMMNYTLGLNISLLHQVGTFCVRIYAFIKGVQTWNQEINCATKLLWVNNNFICQKVSKPIVSPLLNSSSQLKCKFLSRIPAFVFHILSKAEIVVAILILTESQVPLQYFVSGPCWYISYLLFQFFAGTNYVRMLER